MRAAAALGRVQICASLRAGDVAPTEVRRPWLRGHSMVRLVGALRHGVSLSNAFYSRGMDLGIAEKVALVTGADSGIGWHTARMLLQEGTRVVISDIDQGALDEAAAKLPAAPGQLHAFAADVTKLHDLEALRSRVEEAVGEIDILVQSSGMTGAQGQFHEVDDAGLLQTLEVDLMGPVRLVRTFLPHLRTGGWGRIVLVASEDAS